MKMMKIDLEQQVPLSSSCVLAREYTAGAREHRLALRERANACLVGKGTQGASTRASYASREDDAGRGATSIRTGAGLARDV